MTWSSVYFLFLCRSLSKQKILVGATQGNISLENFKSQEINKFARNELVKLPLKKLSALYQYLQTRHQNNEANSTNTIIGTKRRLLYTNYAKGSLIFGSSAPMVSSTISSSNEVPFNYMSTLIGDTGKSTISDMEGYEPNGGYNAFEQETPECNRLLNAYVGVCLFNHISDESLCIF